MSQVMSSIGSIFSPQNLSTFGKIAQPVMGGLGVVSNLIQGNRASQIQSNAINQQKQLMALINNPAAFNAKIQALQQPLSGSLINSVGNGVQGYMAERGLGSSPQIYGEGMSEALAPYALNEQQMALNAILSAYGLGQGATNSAAGAQPRPIDTSGFWKYLQSQPSAAPKPNSSPTDPLQWPGDPGITLPSALPPNGSQGYYPGTTSPDYDWQS